MIETWIINSNSMINSIEHQLNNVWFLLYRQNWTRYRTRAKSSGSMGQFNGGKKRSVSSCSGIRYPWCPCWLESSCRHGTTYSCSVSWSQRCVQLYYLIHIIFHHISLTIFKLFTADDLSTHQSGEEVSVTGVNSILPKEHGNKFYNLPIIRHIEKDVCAIAAWDSSIHDNKHLNKVTDGKVVIITVIKNIENYKYFKL